MVLSLPIQLYPATEMLDIMVQAWKDQLRESRKTPDQQKILSEKSPLQYFNRNATYDKNIKGLDEKSTTLRLTLAFLIVSLGTCVPSFTFFSSVVGAVGLSF